MRRVVSLLLAAVLLLSGTVFAVPVIDSVESVNAIAVEDKAISEDSAGAVLASTDVVKPGLNIYTGTTSALTFDNATENAALTIVNSAVMTKAKGDDAENKAMALKTAWAYFYMDVPTVEKDRPVLIGFDYIYGTQFRVVLNSEFNHSTSAIRTVYHNSAPEGWQTAATYTYYGDLTKNPDKTGYTKSNEIERFYFMNLDVAPSGENYVFVDNIKIIPGYKINYDANGGSGTVEADYFMSGTYTNLDDGSTLTNGTREFLGWSLTPDGEAVTSVTGTPGSDITLYAVWSENSSVVIQRGIKPGLNILSSTATAWTFEASDGMSDFGDGIVKSYNVNEIENAANPSVDSVNSSSTVLKYSVQHTGTGIIYPQIKFNLTQNVEKERPFYVSLKHFKNYTPVDGEAITLDNGNLWLLANGGNVAWGIHGNTVNSTWRIRDSLMTFDPKDPEELEYMYLQAEHRPGNAGYFNYYLDDIYIVPSYKITYMENDGTDTVTATNYALFPNDDITKSMLTKYTVDSSVKPEDRFRYNFLGWSEKADGTAEDIVTEIDLNNEDIVLYAVWEVDNTATLKWDFETPKSQVWYECNTGYSTSYKNGMYIVDTTNATSTSYIKHPDFTDGTVIDTDTFKYLVVKARSLDTVSELKFYFTTTDSTAFDEVKIAYFKNIETNASTFKECAIDLSENELWTGDYVNCMLKSNSGSGIIEFEEIYFTSSYDFKQSEETKEFHYDLSGATAFDSFGNTAFLNNGNGSYTVKKESFYINRDGTPRYYKYDEATGEFIKDGNSYISTDSDGNPLTAENGKTLPYTQGAYYTYDTASLLLDSSVYNKLVIKTNNPNGITGFYVYYQTSGNTGYTDDKILYADKLNEDSDGYVCYVADMSELTSFAGTGNVKSFMIQPVGTGTIQVCDMYLTNVLELEEEIEIEKLAFYATSDKITTDRGTVTLYPYVRYSDGTELEEFDDVYYVTDSVNAHIKKNSDGTATVTGQINGTVGISVVMPSFNARATQTITIENQAERIPATSLKLSMFGNSILHHGPAESDGWLGNWGMAASSMDKAYVYRLIHYLDEKYGANTAKLASATNFSNFERAIKGSGTEKDWSEDTNVVSYVNTVKNAQPDIITIQMGENVASDVTVAEYVHATTSFVKALQEAAPDALIVVCTPFWGGENKIEGMKATAEACDVPIALIHPLGEGAWTSDNENFAFNSAFLKDAGCTSTGIMAHPGDVGMDNIAKLIFEQINIVYSENEPTKYTVTPASIEITAAGDAEIIDTPYGTLQLSAQIFPEDAAQDVVWTVNDEVIGTVSENGLVSAVNNGLLKVTATSKHVSSVSATVEIDISEQTEPHTITYNANTTDTVSNLPETYNYAKENYEFPSIYPERSTYSFLGWSLTENGEIISAPFDVKEDITVYAQWEKAYRWEFNKADYLEMFSVSFGFNNRVDNGIYQVIATGTDVSGGQVLKIISPELDLSSDDYQALVINMTNTEFLSDTNAVLTIKTTDGEFEFTKPVTTASETKYEFVLDGVTGTITGFELVPTNVDCTVTIDDIVFVGFDANTINTASIKTSVPQGLRYAGFINTCTKELNNVEEFGFIIAADEYFTTGDYSELVFNESGDSSAVIGNSKYKYLSAAAYKKNAVDVSEYLTAKDAADVFESVDSNLLENGYYFSVIMTNIPENHYTDAVAGRAYIKIDGTYYYGETVVKSVYDMALAYQKNYGENNTPEYIKSIIDIVNASYEISFSANGNVFKTAAFKFNSFIEFPEAPEKLSDVTYVYEFSHWSETENGPAIDDGEVRANSDKTYYAVYSSSSNVNGWDGVSTKVFVNGDGTMESPYEISDGFQLYNLSKLVNEGVGSYTQAYYVLTDNIDLSGCEWTPIGTSDYPFKGHLDGNGYSIYNYKFTNPETRFVGLFGYIDGAKVIRLKLRALIYDFSTEDIITTDDARVYVGGIAGFVTSSVLNSTSRISECSVSAVYTINKNSATSKSAVYAGGISGYIQTDAGYVYVENCYSDAAITIGDMHDSECNTRYVFCGGIVGDMKVTTGYVSGIDKCYFSGKIDIAAKTSGYAGGIAGFLENYTGNAGGVVSLYVSENTGDIRNCFVTAEAISVSGATNAYAGHVSAYINSNAKIFNCASAKAVTVSAESTADTSGIIIHSLNETFTDKDYLSDTLGFDFNSVWKISDGCLPELI